MDYFSDFPQSMTNLATDIGLKVLGAFALWLIGSWLIRIAVKLTERAMKNQKVDKTIIGYVGSTMTIALKIMLVISILRLFGFETTTFAALLAALGLAIGLAWSGLLSNVAAGAFLVILRPFKTGDVVTVANITGKVEEVGLFMTIINAGTGRIYINNSKILNDNINIHASIPNRQVDCQVQLDYTTDHDVEIEWIRERVSQIPNVLPEPPVEIGITSITSMGPVLAVKPGCAPQHCKQVHYDTNRVLCEALSEASFLVPKQHRSIRSRRNEGNKDLKERAF